MDKKIIVGFVGLAVLAVLLVGVVFFDKPAQVTVNVPEQSLGAFPGPDILESRLNFNGVPYNFHGRSFQVATGTVFAARSPSATSTLELTLSVNVATATAQL